MASVSAWRSLWRSVLGQETNESEYSFPGEIHAHRHPLSKPQGPRAPGLHWQWGPLEDWLKQDEITMTIINNNDKTHCAKHSDLISSLDNPRDNSYY